MRAEIGVFPKDRQILSDILPLDTPLCVDIHITHFCNFKCNYCILSQPNAFEKSGLPSGAMTWDTFCLLVEQLMAFPSKIKMITMSGIGEATTHPQIVDMVKKLHDVNVTDKVQIITNAALLTPKLGEDLVAAGLGELRVSLQGLSEKSYVEIAGRKINWDEFYSNLCHFSKIKGKCDLKIKIADTALGPGDEEKFYDLFGDICDAVAIEHIYDAWAHNGCRLDIEEKPSEKTRYGLEMRKIVACRFPFTRFDILPDGMFTQVCHVRFGHEKNIRESTVVEQWNSTGQNELRMNMLKIGRNYYPVCQLCNYCEGMWHPEDLLEGHEKEILNRMKSDRSVGG